MIACMININTLILKRMSFFLPLLACKVCSQSKLGWALYIRLNITQRFEFEAKYHRVNKPFFRQFFFLPSFIYHGYYFPLIKTNVTLKNDAVSINITFIQRDLDRRVRFIIRKL